MGSSTHPLLYLLFAPCVVVDVSKQRLIGVVGADVRLVEFGDIAHSDETLNFLTSKSQTCSTFNLTSCQMEALRQVCGVVQRARVLSTRTQRVWARAIMLLTATLLSCLGWREPGH